MTDSKFTIFIVHASDLLTDHQPHGDGLTAYEFISRLAQRGHTLHVAAPEIDLRTPLPSNVHLHQLRTRLRGVLGHRLEYMVRSRLLLRRLRRQLRARGEQFDLLHQLNPVNKGISLAMLGVRLPLVLGVIVPNWPGDAEQAAVTLRDRARGALQGWIKQRLLAWQQRQAAALLVATPAARNDLHCPDRIAAKIFEVPLGIDSTRFFPRSDGPAAEATTAKAEPAAAPNILFLANLWRRKGIFTLLDAFARVAEALPDCRLTIAGGGGEEAEVIRRVNEASYRDRVTLLGPVQRDRVPELLRASTVYCLPSYGEPFAISVLEAMASGKPVVATNAGGIREMIPDDGGRKVPPRDADALAAALIEIAGSPTLQLAMGRRNRQWVEQRFAWDRVIDQLEAIYEQVTTVCPQSQVNSLAADFIK